MRKKDKQKECPMKKPLIFSTEDCHRHIDQYQRDWELTDRTLYSLCRENYFHDSMNAINAKLWIIDGWLLQN